MPHIVRRALAVAALAGCVVSAGACAVPSVDDDAAPLADITTSRDVAQAENGIDELTPRQALDVVLETLQEKGSFTVTGSMMRGGRLDITYVVDVGAAGSIGESADDESPVEMIAADDTIYVTGDEEFLAESVGEEAAEAIADKWVLLSEESAESFEVLADGRRFTEMVFDRVGPPADMTGVREVDGAPAVGLLFDDTGAILWVAASGDPVPVRLEEKGASGDTGVLRFKDVGSEVDLEVPDEDSVVDAEKLLED